MNRAFMIGLLLLSSQLNSEEIKWSTSSVEDTVLTRVNGNIRIGSLYTGPAVEFRLPIDEIMRRGVRIIIEDDSSGGVKISVYDRRKDDFDTTYWEKRNMCGGGLYPYNGSNAVLIQ